MNPGAQLDEISQIEHAYVTSTSKLFIKKSHS